MIEVFKIFNGNDMVALDTFTTKACLQGHMDKLFKNSFRINIGELKASSLEHSR